MVDHDLTRRDFLAKAGMVGIGSVSFPLLSGCSTGPSSGSSQAFIIGDLSSFTGPFSPYGKPISNGLHIGVDEINSRGGLLGKIPVTVIDADTASDPNTAVQQSRQLMDQRHVDAMFGVEASNLRKAVLPEVEKRHRLLLYPVNYEGHEYSDNCLYLGHEPSQDSKAAYYTYLAEQAGGAKIYLLGSDYVSIQTVFKYVKETVAPAAKLDIVGSEFAPLTQSDFSATIQRINAAKPNILLNDLIGESTIALQKQAANLGLRPLRQGEQPGTPGTIVMYGDAYVESTVSAMGPAAEGVFREFQWTETVDTPASKAFVATYKKKYPSDLLIYLSAAAYSAALVLEAAAKRANSVQIAALIKAVPGVTVQDPGGPLTVRADHHADSHEYMTRYQGGSFAVVKNFGTVSPDSDQRQYKGTI